MNEENYIFEGINLKTANVFELTTNEEYLKKFLSPELGILTTADYLQKVNNSTTRIFDMFDYAETFQITDLISKLESLYKDELASFFNE